MKANLSDKAARAALVAQNALFARAFDFFDAHTLEELAQMRGKVDLGEGVFCSFAENNLKPHSAAKLEAHDKYIDLQLVLRGSERIGLLPRGQCASVVEDKLAESDVVFFGDDFSEAVELCAGEYAVLYPDTAHAPCVGEGVDIKCVAKIPR